MDAPNLLTGHSYILHTLHVLVGTRGLTFLQHVPLPSTHYSTRQSSSVCNLMRRLPIRLLLPAYGVRTSPLIYPPNRIWSDERLRPICCYKMCSIDSGLWCWDATTQAASDHTLSQHRGWKWVLSFSFEGRACQGRVTLASNSFRGVRAPNTFLAL